MSSPSSVPSERKRRLHGLVAAYLEAVEAGRAPDRQDLLRGHPDLADDLRAFFANHDRLAQLGEPLRAARPSPATTPAALGEPAPGDPALGRVRYFGDYELLEEVARGGMGIVFKARQVSLNRVVALKMVLAGQFASDADVQRFRAEAETAANLDHPNIVPIHEVGQHEGQHYFSMKLIEGGSLSQAMATGRWPLAGNAGMRQVAQLVAAVARAVHYAHQRGLLHRDLKPGNILLDARGQPHVTDFGLVKRVDAAESLSPSGAIVGTPSYMAPEQAAARKGLTTAGDVYGLGAILYELLTGRPPFRAETPLDTLRQVLEKEPARPRALHPAIDRDLETICLKCLEKEAPKRYASAEALADDLERWLRGEPIQARPAGPLERTLKWARRRPAVAALAGVLAAAVLSVGGLAGALWYQAEQRAATEGQLNEQLQEKAGRLQEQAGQLRQQAETERELGGQLKGQRDLAEGRLHYARNLLLTMQLQRVGAMYRQDPERARELLHDPLSCPPDLRDFTWGLYDRLCRLDRATIKAVSPARPVPVTGWLLFSPDGRSLAVVSGPRGTDCAVVDATTGKVRFAFAEHGWYFWYPSSSAFSPDGKTLATLRSKDVGPYRARLQFWRVTDGKELNLLEKLDLEGRVLAMVYSPDGRLLAVRGKQEIAVYDLATGRKTVSLLKDQDNEETQMAFSPDSKTLATGNRKAIQLWDVKAGKEAQALKGEGWQFLAFSPDGKTLIASAGGETRRWDLSTGKWQTFRDKLFLQGPRMGAPDPRSLLSPDCKTVAERNGDEVWLWDLETGTCRLRIPDRVGRWPGLRTPGLAFSPDSRRLATYALVGKDTEGGPVYGIKLWDTATGRELAVFYKGHKGAGMMLAFSPDGRTLASSVGGPEAEVKLWDVSGRQESFALGGHEGEVYQVAYATDGKLLATVSYGKLKLWDAATGQERAILKGVWAERVAFSPDRRTLAVGAQQQVQLWDLPTGKLRRTFRVWPPGINPDIGLLRFSPDGKRLVVKGGRFSRGLGGGGLVWLDVATGNVTDVSRSGSCLDISPDGKWLAVAGTVREDEVLLVDLAAGGKEVLLRGHKHRVHSLAFSPDGKLLASGSGGIPYREWEGRGLVGELKLWDVGTGQALESFRGHQGWVTALAFAPDGHTLASGGVIYPKDGSFDTAGELKLWDVATRQERAALDAPASLVTSVAFSPDGKALAAGGGQTTNERPGLQGVVKVWSARSHRE
jgi:eukaryotic-like serine/threonine-protein kinase